MRKILILLCICAAINLPAQEIKVNLSTPAGNLESGVSSFHPYGQYLYANKTNYGKAQFAFTASLKKMKYGIELFQYDEGLKEIKTLSLDNGAKDFGPFLPVVHYGKSFIYIIYFKYTGEDKIKMYAAKVSPDGLTLATTKEIMEYDQHNQAFFGAVKTISNTQVLLTVSEDEKNMWIVHSSPTLLFSTVVDGDLAVTQKLQSTSIRFENFVVTAAHMDNDGSKILTYRHNDPAITDFYGRGMFFQPANAKGVFKAIKPTKGNHPGLLTLKRSRDGKKLYYAGDYFNDNFIGAQGVLLGEVNVAAQSVSIPAFYPYSDELKKTVLDLDFASKKKGDIFFTDRNMYYTINEMQNGTIVLSADMHSSASTSSMSVTFYWRGPVIHAFIKAGTTTASMSVIRKAQPRSAVTNYFNYIYQDKLICLYADHPKFFNKELSDKQIGLVRNEDNLVPVVDIYDADGKLLSRKTLLDEKNAMKGSLLIGNAAKLADNKFLFPVSGSKMNQLCYLEIL